MRTYSYIFVFLLFKKTLNKKNIFSFKRRRLTYNRLIKRLLCLIIIPYGVISKSLISLSYCVDISLQSYPIYSISCMLNIKRFRLIINKVKMSCMQAFSFINHTYGPLRKRILYRRIWLLLIQGYLVAWLSS